MKTEIREARNRRDLKRFILFAFSHYKSNKFWVPPLISGELEMMNTKINPAFDHCEAVFYLAYQDGKIVGRIAGIINHLFIKQWEKKWARFFWFEFIDDPEVSGALLQAVENWARNRGMEGLIGPQGFSTFERQGILVHGFDETPTFSSVYNFPYYLRHLEEHGYAKEVDYVEYVANTPGEVPEKALKLRDLVLQRYNLSTMQAKTKKEMAPYASQVFEVINEAYKPLFGFVPLTARQIEYYVKKYFSFLSPDFTTAVLDPNGKVIGFQISVPSLSKAFQKARGKLLPFGFIHLLRAMKKPDRIDILLVAIHPDYQNKGINSVFMTDLTNILIKKGVRYAESNGELEENVKVQSFWKYYDARQYKRTRVFFKSIDQ